MDWRLRRPSSRVWWRLVVVATLGATIALVVEVFGLYALVLTPMDTVAHASAGAALGAVFALFGRRIGRYQTQHRVLSVILVAQVAIIWEGLEVLLPGFAGIVTLGLVDTVVDVLATVGGAILAMLVVPGGGGAAR